MTPNFNIDDDDWEILIWDDGPQEVITAHHGQVIYRFAVTNGGYHWTYLNYHITQSELLQNYFDGKITAYELGYNSNVYKSIDTTYTYMTPEEFDSEYSYLKKARWFLDFKPEILPHAIALLNSGINPDLYNS